MKKLATIYSLLAVMLLSVPSAIAQDPTKVDSKHYKVVFENDQVRVIRITYGPREKSVMYYHPDAVAVLLTDNEVKFTLPDGKTIENIGDKGQAFWTSAGKHLPQNTSDKSMELILVEMKNKPKVKMKSRY